MTDTTPTEPSPQRRRSTRVVRTVPLTVRGVDLLSQPFEERTATLAFNTYGCKYPSKHHLPKNTWITLELPAQEGGEGRHRVRARVVWIQRPRSVRELFQVAVELEAPGNIWHLDGAPEDWTATASPALEASASTPPAPEKRPDPADVVAAWFQELDSAHRAESEKTSDSSGLHVVAPSSEIAAHAAASATPVSGFPGAVEMQSMDVSSLESPLLSELRAQIEKQAAKLFNDASARAIDALRAAQTSEQERIASAETFYLRWKEEFERDALAAREETLKQVREHAAGVRDDIASHFTGQMAWVREELRSDLKQEFTAHLDQVRSLIADLERGSQALHNEAGVAAATSDRLAALRLSLEGAEAALEQRLRKHEDAAIRESATLEDLSEAWRERLESQMKVASSEWDELLQSSLDGAAQRLASRLAESTRGALDGAEIKLAERIAQLGQPVSGAITDARETLANIQTSIASELQRARTSLSEIERGADRMKEFSGQMEAASQDAINQLHRRMETALETQVAEFRRQSESIAAALPQRVQPLMEAAGQQFTARTLADLDAKLLPHLERVPGLLRELAAREVQAEESLRMHRERLRQAAESSRRDAATQMSATLASLQNDFEAARREALVHWNEELAASGARATHAAVEGLVQSADWHQQQAKERIDVLTQESLRKAEAAFEEKTSEVAEKFAAELSKREVSFVEATEAQLQIAAAAVTARSSGEIEAVAGKTSEALRRRLESLSGEVAHQFEQTSQATVAARTMELGRIADEASRNFDAANSAGLVTFREQLTGLLQRSIVEARDSHARELAAAMQTARVERDKHDQEWSYQLSRANDDSLRKYEQSLRDANAAWMKTALEQLNESGEVAVNSLSHLGEQALRAAFLGIFEQITGTIRQSVQGAATAPAEAKAAAAAASTSSSTPPPIIPQGQTETHASA